VEEALAYLPTLALFGFVIVASALMRHEMLILACIPPVFVAMIVGFVMAIYAGDTFGWPTAGAALALGAPSGWWMARRLKPRDLLIAIYLAWAIALVMALVAFRFPDHT
jgi:peptidoglycan/LPS O-acetylase OafA/YrhL